MLPATAFQQIPDAKTTGDFLLQGGAFALLCVIILCGLVALWFGGKALFNLLREFLTATNLQLAAQVKLLGEIHEEQRQARVSLDATAEACAAWGSPDWLNRRLDLLEKRAEEIKDQVSQLRIAVAKQEP